MANFLYDVGMSRSFLNAIQNSDATKEKTDNSSCLEIKYTCMIKFLKSHDKVIR